MKRMATRSFLILFTLILTLVAALVGCGSSGGQTSKASQTASVVKAGSPAPDFTLKTNSGQTVTLSQLRGKKVFLNFWASWCGPCKQEMPELESLSKKYDKQVVVYGVNMTQDDTLERANEFMLEMKMTFPSVLDVEGIVRKAYRVTGYPASFTIDEQGKIVDRHDGQLTASDMQAMFNHLLQAKS